MKRFQICLVSIICLFAISCGRSDGRPDPYDHEPMIAVDVPTEQDETNNVVPVDEGPKTLKSANIHSEQGDYYVEYYENGIVSHIESTNSNYGHSYDENGILTKISHYENGELGKIDYEDRYTYDDYGLVKSYEEVNKDGTSILFEYQIEYTYDENGAISQILYNAEDPANSILYTYENGRVVKKDGGDWYTTYTYDDEEHSISTKDYGIFNDEPYYKGGNTVYDWYGDGEIDRLYIFEPDKEYATKCYQFLYGYGGCIIIDEYEYNAFVEDLYERTDSYTIEYDDNENIITSDAFYSDCDDLVAFINKDYENMTYPSRKSYMTFVNNY